MRQAMKRDAATGLAWRARWSLLLSARLRGYGYIVGWSLVVVWTALVCALVLTLHPTASDWSMYYDTARALRAMPHANLSLFTTTVWGSHLPGACTLWPGAYNYPPLLALLLAPLTLLPCAPATLVWRVISLALWLGCAASFALPAWRARSWGWALTGAALVTLYLPAIDGMLLGQAHLVILACCLLGAALVARGRATLGGGALAFGAWIKYVPGAVIFYYALIGRWRVVAGALLVGLLLLLGQLAIVGPTSLLESLAPVAHVSIAPSDAIWGGLPGGIFWGVAACGAFAAGVLLARWRGVSPANEALGVGWALCTMVIFSPVVWWLYLTWLLPAFWACLRIVARRDEDASAWPGLRGGLAAWGPRMALGLAFALTLIPFSHPAIVAGTLLLWMLCGALYLRSAGLRLARQAAPAAVVARPV